MNKLIPKLIYDDVYFLPVKSENINAGWLEWMNNFQITQYIIAESKKYTVEDMQNYLDSDDFLVFLACYRRVDDFYLGNLRIYQLSPGILSFGRLIGDLRFHGLGYGTKLTKVAIDLCFNWFRTDLIVVGNHEEQKASAVSKIKAGFSIADSSLLAQWGLDLIYNKHYNAYYMDKESFLKGQA